MKVRGLRDCLRLLDVAGNNHPAKIKKAVREAGRNTLNKAKLKAPLLTGKLKRSGFVESINEGYGTRITFSADYAPFMEFGTGGLVDIPSGFEELATQFKGNGVKKINLKAQPFLIPAFQEEAPKLIEQCRKIVNNQI